MMMVMMMVLVVMLEFWPVRFDANKLQGSPTKERLATPWQSVTAVETQKIFKRQEL